MMRIVYDARAVQQRSDGIGNYTRQLLLHLLQIDHTNHYTVLLSRVSFQSLSDILLLQTPNIHLVMSPVPFMAVRQHIQIPWRLWNLRGVDLYHYPHFDLPCLAHPRSVVTIHDLNQFEFPNYFESLRLLKRFYCFGATWLSTTAAVHVLTVSRTTREGLLRHFPWLPPHRVTAIHSAVDERLYRPSAPEHLRAIRQRYHLGSDRYLLYVGTQRPHKNLARVLAAYAVLRRSGRIAHKFLVVGIGREQAKLHQLIAELGIADDVQCIGYVPDNDLPLVYRTAEAFVFCSLSEGFGLPILEAMACGVPVVTSGRGAMTEVAGDAAVLVDPESVDSIAEGMCQALLSGAQRNRLIQRGVERAQRFTWEETARRTLEVYRQASQSTRCAGEGSNAAPAGRVKVDRDAPLQAELVESSSNSKEASDAMGWEAQKFLPAAAQKHHLH